MLHLYLYTSVCCNFQQPVVQRYLIKSLFFICTDSNTHNTSSLYLFVCTPRLFSFRTYILFSIHFSWSPLFITELRYTSDCNYNNCNCVVWCVFLLQGKQRLFSVNFIIYNFVYSVALLFLSISVFVSQSFIPSRYTLWLYIVLYTYPKIRIFTPARVN